MMQAVITDVAGGEGFVGHLGGDDFVVVVPSAAAALAADTIVTRFDQAAPTYYDDTDLQRGWIEVLNRRGEPSATKRSRCRSAWPARSAARSRISRR